MRQDLTLQRRSRSRSWRGLEIVLLLAFLAFLAIGLTALYLLWSMIRQPTPNLDAAPLETLQIERIVPQLAIQHLAGNPLDGLARQALEAGEGATAYALLLTSTQIEPTPLAALWLQLAQRQSERQDLLVAVRAARRAQTITILNVRLSPLEKVNLLTQIARVYINCEQSTSALTALEQAVIIIVQTPNFLPAQRSQLLTALQAVFTDIEANEASRALKLRIDDFARNPFVTANGVLISSTLFSLVAPVSLNDAISATLANRQQAALALAERFRLTSGLDVEPEKETLRSTLLTEDQTRQAAITQRLSGNVSLQQQLELLLVHREWLATKLRIALKGYGLELVPEWTADLAVIRRDLATNTANLNTVFEAFVAGQPDAIQQAHLRAEAILWQAEQFELGLYPDAQQNDLNERLRFALSELERVAGVPALPVTFSVESVSPGYLIQQK